VEVVRHAKVVGGKWRSIGILMWRSCTMIGSIEHSPAGRLASYQEGCFRTRRSMAQAEQSRVKRARTARSPYCLTATHVSRAEDQHVRSLCTKSTVAWPHRIHGLIPSVGLSTIDYWLFLSGLPSLPCSRCATFAAPGVHNDCIIVISNLFFRNHLGC